MCGVFTPHPEQVGESSTLTTRNPKEPAYSVVNFYSYCTTLIFRMSSPKPTNPDFPPILPHHPIPPLPPLLDLHLRLGNRFLLGLKLPYLALRPIRPQPPPGAHDGPGPEQGRAPAHPVPAALVLLQVYFDEQLHAHWGRIARGREGGKLGRSPVLWAGRSASGWPPARAGSPFCHVHTTVEKLHGGTPV